MTDVLRQLPNNSIREQMFPQAILHASIEKLVSASGIHFSHFDDDLDGYAAAFLRVEDPLRRSEKSDNNQDQFLTFSRGPSLLSWDVKENDLEFTGMGAVCFMLHRYDKEPDGLVTLFLPEHFSTQRTVESTVFRIIKVFHLSNDALFWIQKDS